MLKALAFARVRIAQAFIRGVREHKSAFTPFYHSANEMLAHHWGCYIGEQIMKYIVPILTGILCVLTVGCEIAFRLGYLGA